jgi:hypothetical protein
LSEKSIVCVELLSSVKILHNAASARKVEMSRVYLVGDDGSSSDPDPEDPHYDVTTDILSPYYLGPAGTHLSIDEIIGGEYLHADRKGAFDGWASKLLSSALQLTSGCSRMEPYGKVWDNASHEQMYDSILNWASAIEVAERSAQCLRIGHELTALHDDLVDLVDGVCQASVGIIAEAAQTSTSRISKTMRTAARDIIEFGNRQRIYALALNEAQRDMLANPPVEFSVAESSRRLQLTTDPIEYAFRIERDAEVRRGQQDARSKALLIMKKFDQKVAEVAAMPSEQVW